MQKKIMNQAQVFELLAQHQNQRGIEHWQKLEHTDGLTSYGIGLTVQRKLAKQIGKNRALAQQLWATNCYDAKVLALLIDEPKKITFEQAESQVEQLHAGMLRHVFSSCDATLAKSPIVFELTQRWLASSDTNRRSCAFGLVYELSKKKSKVYTDEFFLSVLEDIKRNFDREPKSIKLAMASALMGIGKRNLILSQAALPLAKEQGEIDFNEDGQNCQPLDVVKHLTSDYIKNKFNIS